MQSKLLSSQKKQQEVLAIRGKARSYAIQGLKFRDLEHRMCSRKLCSTGTIFTAQQHAIVVYAVVVCLSVCLSQVGVLLKRLNIGSRKQRRTIAQGLQFSVPKISAKLKRGHRNGGAKCRRGRLQLTTCDK